MCVKIWGSGVESGSWHLLLTQATTLVFSLRCPRTWLWAAAMLTLQAWSYRTEDGPGTHREISGARSSKISYLADLNLSKNPEQVNLISLLRREDKIVPSSLTRTSGNSDEWCREKRAMDYEPPQEMNFKRNPKHHESQAVLFSHSWPSSTFSSIKRMEMCYSRHSDCFLVVQQLK